VFLPRHHDAQINITVLIKNQNLFFFRAFWSC